MDIIRTGINVTKTFRNISRLREIVLTLARYGFDEFISLGVTSRIPNFVLPKSKRGIKAELAEAKETDWQGIVGKRLRQSFEELGPAFVKFGQLLSGREDLFDESFIREMKLLRDQVKPIPFSEVKDTIEDSLGQKLEDVFEYFEEKPLGTASIGVVYKAKLKGGDEVVVKVKRPNIDKIIETDFSIILFLALQVEKVSEEIKFLGISRVVKDFSGSIQNELNFHIEGFNCERFKENLKKHDTTGILHVPQIYKDFSRDNILVMEFMDGIPFSDSTAIEPHKEKIKETLDEGLVIFLKTFLQDGFFHADLHGGNFFLLKNGKLGIVDYGLMGSLSKKSRQNFIAILYSLGDFNYENLVYEFLDVAEYETIPDIEKLIADVKEALSPFVGLTVQQTNYNVALQAIIQTLKRHKIYLPRDWFIVFRALITLDGVGRSLDYDIDIFKLLAEDMENLIKSTVTKEDLIEEAVWLGRDVLTSAKTLPRHIKWFTRTWAKNGYAFEMRHENLDKHVSTLSDSMLFLGFIFLTGIFFMSGVFLLGDNQFSSWREIPIITWIFWSIGSLNLLKALRLSKK